MIIQSKYILTLLCTILYFQFVPAKRNIYIAGFYPQTGGWSIPLATISAKLALRHLNNESDILKDYNLNIDWKNTNCTAKLALKSFIDYLDADREYVCIFGPGCSTGAVEVGLVAHFYNLAMISYSATAPTLSETERYKYFARIIPSDTNAVQARVNFIVKHGWKRVGIISEDKENFISQANLLEIELINNKISVQKASFGESSIQSYYISQIESTFNLFTKERYWIIVTNMYEEAAIQFFCQLKKYKDNNKLPYITWIFISWYTKGWYSNAAEVTNGACTIYDIKEMANGLIGMAPLPLLPDFNNSNHTAISGYKPQQLYEEYKKLALEEGGYDVDKLGNDHEPYAYDGVWSIALALNQTIQKGFNIENQTYLGYSPLAFAGEIYKYVVKQSFIGWTGNVSYEGNTRYDNRVRIQEFVQGDIIQRGLYIINNNLNGQENKFPEFHIWKSEMASDGTAIYSSPPVIFYLLTIFSFIAAIYITAIIIFILVATIKKLPPTVLSGPGMNIFILCGTYFLLFAAIRISMKGNEDTLKLYTEKVYCYSIPWLISIALDMILGGIIIKASKYYLIWVHHKFKMKFWYLIPIPIVLAIIDTIITIVFIFNVPNELIQTSQDFGNMQDPILYVKTCTYTKPEFELVFLLILYIPKLIIMLIGLFMAYNLRRVVNKAQRYSSIIVWAMYNSIVFTILIFSLERFIPDLKANAIVAGLFAIIDAIVIATIISAPVIYNTVRDPHGKKLASFKKYGVRGEFPEDKDMLKLRIKSLERDFEEYKRKNKGSEDQTQCQMTTSPVLLVCEKNADTYNENEIYDNLNKSTI